MLFLSELGARLKEARVAKGLSIDDLQEITKIQKRYLVGIEEGNYATMPGAFYVRAFIKQYAEAVGLDAEEILASYQKEIPGVQKEDAAQVFTQNTRRRKISSTSSNKLMESMPMMIAALFIIVIIVFSWYLWQQKVSNKPEPELDEPNVQYDNNNVGKPEDEKPVVEPDEENDPSVEEGKEEELPKQVVTQTAVNGQDVLFDVTGTDQLKIRAEIVEQSSWVAFRNTQGIDQLGKEYFQGQTVEYDATEDKYVRIRLGRQASVNIYVNDELITSTSNEFTQNFILQLVPQQ